MDVVDSLIGVGIWMDSLIYGLITKIYSLIITVAQYQVFSSDTIGSISSRIYALTGIFMLFKITFSMISYLINPDEFSDKTRGFGGLIKNVILSMVLIVAVPYIFNEAYYVQKMILEDGTIAKIVLTEDGDASSITLMSDEPGDKITFLLFSQFAAPNTKIEELSSCEFIYKYDNNNKRAMNDQKTNYIFNQNCRSAMENLLGNDKKYVTPYVMAMEYETMELLTAQDYLFKKRVTVSDSTTGNQYEARVISYRWPISTIVGLIVLVVMVTICIDIAVRSIKLGFYQVIAPIPILSNCTPSGKKDGMLQKWVKACVATYLDLFIRLFTLFLAILLIIKLTEDNTFSGFASVILILGALIFAKQAPKLMQDVIGLKMDDFTLNPFKKIEKDALGGKAITDTARGVGRFAGGFALGEASGILGALSGAGAGRLLTGGFAGGIAGANKKKAGDIWKTGAARNASMRSARLDGSTFGGRLGAHISNALGTGGEMAEIEREKHQIKDQIDAIDNQIKAAEDRKNEIKGTQAYRERQQRLAQQGDVAKYAGKMKERGIEQVNNGEGAAGRRYLKMLQDAKQAEAENRGADAERLRQAAEHYKNNEGWRGYITEASHNHDLDATFNGIQTKFDDAAGVVGINIDHNAAGYGALLNSALGTAKGNVAELEVEGAADERDLAAIDREISDYQSQKSPLNDQMRNLNDRETTAKANQSAIK